MNKKTIFITGAGSGLGKEAAIALAKRGHKVIATVHYDNQIDELMSHVNKNNLDMKVYKLDILLEEDRNTILRYTNIDVLICNAAIGDSGSISEIDVNKLRNVFETNVFANISLVQLALKNMIEIQKEGKIIFLSSLVGRITMPWLSPYCATKFAIEAYAISLRKEVKLLEDANIQIGIVEPGAYATGFNKENNMKKYSFMKEKSYFKNYLASIEKKEYITWNFLEQKPYTSIVCQYIKAVEDKHLKTRYVAPKWQGFFVQLGRIFGM